MLMVSVEASAPILIPVPPEAHVPPAVPVACKTKRVAVTAAGVVEPRANGNGKN